MKTNKFAICAFALSIIAICLTFFRITPLEFSNDIYLGLLATFIGIAVTMLIGYQIFNAIDIKKEVLEQKKITEELRVMNAEISKTIKKQENETNEGFDIISAMITYNKEGWVASIRAFIGLHSALIYSIKTDRTDYEWIFLLLREYISNINWQNFVSGFITSDEGKFICDTPGNPHHQKELKDIIKEYTDIIDTNELQIRKNDNFCRIQIEYDRVMRLFRKRIDEIIKDPHIVYLYLVN